MLPDQPLTSPGLILGTAPTGAESRAHSPRPGCRGAPIAWVQLMGQPKVMSSPWPPPTPVRSGDVPPLNILSVKRLSQREPHSFQKTEVGCTLIVRPVKVGASTHSQVQLAACFVNKALLALRGDVV